MDLNEYIHILMETGLDIVDATITALGDCGDCESATFDIAEIVKYGNAYVPPEPEHWRDNFTTFEVEESR